MDSKDLCDLEELLEKLHILFARTREAASDLLLPVFQNTRHDPDFYSFVKLCVQTSNNPRAAYLLAQWMEGRDLNALCTAPTPRSRASFGR